MSAAERIVSQGEVAVSTPPDHEECWGARSELICLSKRYKSIVEGMERRQTAERCHRTLVIFSGPSFASMGGTGETVGTGRLGGISSLEAVVERLEGRLNAIIQGLWDAVAVLGCLETATQEVVFDGQAVRAELVGLSGIVQERSKDLLAAAEEATGAIVRLIGSIKVARENA